MSQAQHYKFQAEQAKRLARQVTDSEVRERLLEMAGEYSRYAELMAARERPVERAVADLRSPFPGRTLPIRAREHRALSGLIESKRGSRFLV